MPRRSLPSHFTAYSSLGGEGKYQGRSSLQLPLLPLTFRQTITSGPFFRIFSWVLSSLSPDQPPLGESHSPRLISRCLNITHGPDLSSPIDIPEACKTRCRSGHLFPSLGAFSHGHNPPGTFCHPKLFYQGHTEDLMSCSSLDLLQNVP